MDALSEIDNTGLATSKVLDLSLAYAKRNRAIFRNYADILYPRILDSFHPHKDRIFKQLENAASTPNVPIRARIWDYSVTYRVDGGTADAVDMQDFSNRGHHTVIFDMGHPMSVDAIFRNSDIAWRLAFTFGSKFRVTFVQEETKLISEQYCSYKIGVYVNYHPNGLLPHAEERLIRAYKDVCDRQLYTGDIVYMTSRY